MTKCLFVFVAIVLGAINVFAATRDEQDAFYLKSRKAYHEQEKIWEKMKDDCEEKFPRYFATKSPDYDKAFACKEVVEAKKVEFRKMQDKETCEKIRVCIK